MILDADYITEDGKPIIRIFKKENGEFKVEYDRNFRPYIYALLRDDSAIDEIKKITAQRHGKVVRIVETEKIQRKFLGRPIEVWKLYLEHPQDVPAIRDKIREHPAVVDIFEYDIPFAKRYLIDKGLTPMEGNEKLTFLAVDIETLYHEGEEFGKGPVIMISYADEEGAKVITWKPYVEVVSSEREMIKRLIRVIKEKDPDVIITYNGDNFDFPYLLKRAEKLGIKLLLGRDNSEPKMQKMGDSLAVEIKGRIHFDLFPVIRRTINLPTYTLEAVYEAIFGKPKEKVYADEIAKAWETGEGLERVAKYSMEDAKVTYELGREFFPMEAQLARLVGQPVWDVSRSSTGNLVEWFLLRKAYERNELAPNKPDEKEYERRLRESYEGGYVKEPEKGLWEGIVSLDFRSLYPSIIITHNVSPDTLNREGCEEYDVAPKVGHRFCKDFPGFIPSLLGQLLEERQKIKKRMKESKDPVEKKLLDYRQRAIKILANSILPDEWLPIVENEKVRFVKIGDFIDREIEENAERVKRDGETEILEVKDLKALSFNRETKKSELKKVKALIRHRYSGKVYSIKLKSGRRIKITSGHSLFSVKNGKLVKVRGDELKPGDLVVVPGRLKLPESKQVLNLVELLLKLPEEETSNIVMMIPVKGRKNFFKGMLKTLYWIFGEGERPRTAGRYLKHLERLGYVKLKRRGCEVLDWESLKRYRKLYETLIKTLKYNGNSRAYMVEFNSLRDVVSLMPIEELKEWIIGEPRGPKIGTFIDVDDSFAKLLGYYISSGDVEKDRVKFHSKDQNVLEDIAKLAEKLFGKVRRGRGYIEVSGKISHAIFRVLAEGKRIPEFIFTSPMDIKVAFLKGLNGNAEELTFSTKSELLVNQLILLLNSIGVSDIKIEHEKGVYRVYINKKESSNGDIVLDSVESIEVEKYEGYVYDLSVEDNENFLVGFGLLYAHNSYYGYYGYAKARWYCKECAESVTAWGRQYIDLVRRELEARGFKVLYIDTDGLYATIPGVKDWEEVKRRALEFVDYINSKLPGVLELEYEGFYARGFFVTKKKYALIDEEGKIVTRGLEIVRRDWSEIAKETQARVLEAILKHGNVEEAVKIVKDVTEKLTNYEVPPEKLVIYEQITRPINEYKAIGPHVAVAKRLMARGIKVKPGMVIGYIVLRGDGPISKRAISIEEFDPRKHKYDAEYYIENQVLPAVERILKAFGYKREDLRWQKTKQVGLGAWIKVKKS